MFENNSVLQFIYKLKINDRIPFLNVLVDAYSHNLITSLDKKKKTHKQRKSECSHRYKISYENPD